MLVTRGSDAKGFISLSLICLASVLGAAGTNAQEFSPREYRREIDNPTQVMVLGTAHLNNAAEEWDPAVLDLLMDRLASFKPDVITIENQPGPTTSKIWSYRSVYPEVAVTFAGRALLMARMAGLTLEMDMPQAEAELRRHIGKVGDNPTPAMRRQSAALFAASGDPYSALVQW